MNKKLVILVTLILLLIAGGVFWWWQGEKASKYILWNIPEDTIGKEEKIKIQKAIFENEEIAGREAINYRRKTDSLLSIDNIEIEKDWAWISVSNLDSRTKEVIPTGGSGFLARRTAGEWKVVRIGEKEFLEWLPLVPESLLSKDIKEYLYMILGVPSE